MRMPVARYDRGMEGFEALDEADAVFRDEVQRELGVVDDEAYSAQRAGQAIQQIVQKAMGVRSLLAGVADVPSRTGDDLARAVRMLRDVGDGMRQFGIVPSAAPAVTSMIDALHRLSRTAGPDDVDKVRDEADASLRVLDRVIAQIRNSESLFQGQHHRLEEEADQLRVWSAWLSLPGERRAVLFPALARLAGDLDVVVREPDEWSRMAPWLARTVIDLGDAPADAQTLSFTNTLRVVAEIATKPELSPSDRTRLADAAEAWRAYVRESMRS